MNLIKPVAIVLAICVSSYSSAQDSPKYFSHLAGSISPFIEYRLSGELDASEAITINHYRVFYDNDGRMQSIAYYQGQLPSNRSYFNTHKVSYQYTSLGKVRRYYDSMGQPSTMWRHYYQSNNVHQEVFEASKSKQQLRFYGLDEQSVVLGTGSAQFEVTRLSDKVFIQEHKREDGTAGVIMPNLPFAVVRIEIDDFGYLNSVTNWSLSENKGIDHPELDYAQMSLNFDQYGNELGWEYRNAKGQLVNDPEDGYARIVYSMNWIDRSQGRYQSYTTQTFDESLTPNCPLFPVCSTKVLRDLSGNIIKRVFLNAQKQPVINDQTGDSIVEVDYTPCGLRKEIRRYQGVNKLIEQCGAIRRFDHSASPVKQLTFDHTAKACS